MIRFMVIGMIFLLWSGKVQALPEMKLPVPKVEKLKNGLTVAWFEDHQLPVIDIGLLIESGYVDDPLGKSGTASLLASVLKEGSGGKSAEEFARNVEKLGASTFVSVGDDNFTLGAHGLEEDSEALMDIVAQLALKPNLDLKEFRLEKARTIDTYEHVGDQAATLANLAHQRLLSSGTIYGRGSIHSIKQLKKVELNDIKKFYQDHFVPGNAVLMVVGKFDKNIMSSKIQKYFGQWSGKLQKEKRKTFDNPSLTPQPSEKGLLVERRDLTQAQVRMGMPSPLIDSPDRYALAVANALIGGYFTSRLNVVLRDKMALTYGVNSSFSYSKDQALWSISSSTRNEAVGLFIQTTLQILRVVYQGDITNEEVNSAKEYLVGGFPLSNNTLAAVASRWLSGYVYRLGPSFLNEFIPSVSAVTPDQVRSAVKQHLNPDKLQIVVAGEPADIVKSLKKFKLAPFKQVKPDHLK